MLNHLRNRHFLLFDLITLPVVAYLSYALRLERIDLGVYWPSCLVLAAFALIFMPLVFRLANIYSRYWPYASADDMLHLVAAVTLSSLVIGGWSWLLTQIVPVPALSPAPKSIPVIFSFLACMVTGGVRVLARLRISHVRHRRALQPALIVGAGGAGMMLISELQRNPYVDTQVVGFVDDDPAKQGLRIYGVPVLGNRHNLPALVAGYGIRRVIIAMPTAPGKVIREVVKTCEQAGVRPQIIPGMHELLDGTVNISQLRNVQIEDLLRREPVQTDVSAVQELIRGKRVLITGGGGSIGSELCRQVLRCRPAQLVILGHGENSVFAIDNELRRQLATGASAASAPAASVPAARVGDPPPPTQLATVIADIRFPDRLQAVFAQHRPQIVFHAAAHKHVPLMEMNPAEAVANNVLGTRNLLEAAQAVGVEHFVMISTDKAVNPTSVMGACKRAAELLVLQAARQTGKPYVAVRFGNVLGSRGSVVLTFKQQIASGGPLTVTHPDMRRFFMTIPEAVQLVLQAAVLGRGGEIFMLDMGEPVKIVDLAHDMIKLSGLQVGRDIDVTFTGLRPGEKLFEELFIPGEAYERTRHHKIFIAANASNFVPACLDALAAQLQDAVRCNDDACAVASLHALIPEFRPADPLAEGQAKSVLASPRADRREQPSNPPSELALSEPPGKGNESLTTNH